MAHLLLIEDKSGDIVDRIVFCSDYCRQQYCVENNEVYDGWNGCHEVDETTCEYCEGDC